MPDVVDWVGEEELLPGQTFLVYRNRRTGQVSKVPKELMRDAKTGPAMLSHLQGYGAGGPMTDPAQEGVVRPPSGPAEMRGPMPAPATSGGPADPLGRVVARTAKAGLAKSPPPSAEPPVFSADNDQSLPMYVGQYRSPDNQTAHAYMSPSGESIRVPHDAIETQGHPRDTSARVQAASLLRGRRTQKAADGLAGYKSPLDADREILARLLGPKK